MHGFHVSDLCLDSLCLYLLFANRVNYVVSRLLIKRNIYNSFLETADDLTTSSTAVSIVLDPDLAL